MTAPLVVVGAGGNLGGVFVDGATRLGRGVVALRRGDDVAAAVARAPVGAPILIATGEADLAPAVAAVPVDRRGDVALLQNELTPAKWRALGLDAPTIVVVWSSIKRGAPQLQGRRAAVHGRHAALLVDALAAAGEPAVVLTDDRALREELAAKDAFLLAVNALGLLVDRTVGAWLDAEPSLVDDVLADAITIAAARVDVADRARIRAAVHEEMTLLREMPAKGRTAAGRVRRAVQDADALRLATPYWSAAGLR